MRKPKGKPSVPVANEDLDPDVARYEIMSISEVKAELHHAGIDPRETIAKVKALIAEKLGHRRSVHVEAFLAFLMACAAWMRAPVARQW